MEKRVLKIAAGAVLAMVGIMVFQNCDGGKFEALSSGSTGTDANGMFGSEKLRRRAASNASSFVSSGHSSSNLPADTGISTPPGLSAPPSSAPPSAGVGSGSTNIPAPASTCDSFLQSYSESSPLQFKLKLEGDGRFGLPEGVTHPRYTSIRPVYTLDETDLPSQKLLKILILRDLKIEESVNGKDFVGGAFERSYNDVTRQAVEHPEGTTYQFKLSCKGIILATSDVIKVKHYAQCGGIFNFLPAKEVSRYDMHLGSVVAPDGGSASSWLAALSSAQVIYNKPLYSCGSQWIQAETPKFPSRKNSNGFSFDSSELQNRVDNTIELRNCAQPVVVVANLVAIYNDQAGNPKCLSDVGALSYELETEATRAAAAARVTYNPNAAPSGTCAFPGATDPETNCQFPATNASNGVRVSIEPIQGISGRLESSCVNGAWKDTSVSCMINPADSTGASCDFPGGKDPSSNCVFPAFSAKSGERKSVYSTTGGNGRLSGTCKNGNWVNATVSCQ